MPRAASSGKRPQGAGNHRDNRHENGLVGPGRRVTKQKSQSQLNGSPCLAVDHNAHAPAATAAAPSSTSLPTPPSAPAANGSAKEHHHEDMPSEVQRLPIEGSRRPSLGTYSESSSTESLALSALPPAVPEAAHRRIDVNDAKNANVHRDAGLADSLAAVLHSCPLMDTVAILVILMQVSPMALTTVYMLFTFLTFVPPVTTSSGLSVTEIFDGNQGTPSLTTLVGMDAIMLLIWLFLWAPIQQFMLDLAQVVISMTLGGGGGNSRQGTVNNIFLCIVVILFSHWLRHTKLDRFSRLGTLLGPTPFPSSDRVDPLEPTLRAFEKKGPYGWIRSVLAIHILTQGLVRYVREWYIRRERRDLLSHSQPDPEAAKTPIITVDAPPDTPAGGADGDVSTQQASSTASTKKRRKQSAQVRIRQPLWAALASTKIVMVKEYELSHAASESAGSNATDIHNLGNAPFNTQPEQIWVCYVGCDELCFNTSHFPRPAEMEDKTEASKAIIPQGVDTSKPFYVRVNKAVWKPTRIMPVEGSDGDSQQGSRWTGDIYGLRPLSNYECEFISTQTGEIIFSTSVRTIQAKTRDEPASAAAQATAPSSRRQDSPATTLRKTIEASDVKLADEKARLKAVRKENNRKINALKKEIEKLSTTVQSSGGNDEKLKQKITQNNVSKNQAEQALEELEKELKEYEAIPESLANEHRAKQTAWAAEKARFDGSRAAFKSFKASVEQTVTAIEEEKKALETKRNKIASRTAKIDEQYARITDANARGLDEAERRRQGRAAFEADKARVEQTWLDRIASAKARNSVKAQEVQNLANNMQAFLNSFQHSGGGEYEGGFGISPPSVTANPFDPSAWGAPVPFAPAPSSTWPTSSAPVPPSNLVAQVHPPLPNPIRPPLHVRTRGRSSSMLSNVSGFTEASADDETNNPANTAIAPAGYMTLIPSQEGPSTIHPRVPPGFSFPRSRQHSGSGSGSSSLPGIGSGRSSVRSGSGSAGSVQDPTSPI